MKKLTLASWVKSKVLFFFLMSLPLVSALDFDDFLDLPKYFIDSFLELLTTILNAPITHFLLLIKFLFTIKINIQAFFPLWQIMVYILSLFYGLYILFAGFNFMISGYDPMKRMIAKEWIKNIIIMIVLVQASYFIYEIVLEIEHSLTSSVMSLVGNSIFLFSARDILSGFGLFLISGYGITLLFASTLFFIRYLIIVMGVLFFPLGIFLYFSPVLQDYGKMILNFVVTSIFISFFSALILLASSRIVMLSQFSSYKLFISMSAFTLCNFMMFYFMLFSAIKSAFRTTSKVAVSVAKYAT